MFQSYIITGSNDNEKIKFALQNFFPEIGEKNISFVSENIFSNQPDILIINPEKSIGIEEIRNLQKNILLKPSIFSQKIYLINHAEKLTIEAQNALLKTLEEPPDYIKIFLFSENYENLLPTVLSRCRIIKIINKNPENANEKENIQKEITLFLLKNSIGERIIKSKEIASEREIALEFLKNEILFLRQELLKKVCQGQNDLQLSISDLLSIIKSSQKTKKIIEKNANTRLAIDIFFASFPLVK